MNWADTNMFELYGGGPAGGYVLRTDGIFRWHQDWFQPKTYTFVKGMLVGRANPDAPDTTYINVKIEQEDYELRDDEFLCEFVLLSTSEAESSSEEEEDVGGGDDAAATAAAPADIAPPPEPADECVPAPPLCLPARPPRVFRVFTLFSRVPACADCCLPLRAQGGC